MDRQFRWIDAIGELLVIAAAGLAVCCHRSAPPAGPQHAARTFLSAMKNGDCATVWGLYSSETRRSIEAQAVSLPRDSMYQGHPELYSAPNLACRPTFANPFNSYEPASVTLARADERTAVVGVKKAVYGGYLIPGFWPTTKSYQPREILLVKEENQWKIVRTGPPGLK